MAKQTASARERLEQLNARLNDQLGVTTTIDYQVSRDRFCISGDRQSVATMTDFLRGGGALVIQRSPVYEDDPDFAWAWLCIG